MKKQESDNNVALPTAIVLSPTGEKPVKVTEEDVWGKWNNDRTRRLDKGMIVARTNEKCPYFEDILEYKDVTVVCAIKDYDEVVYWLEYVQGAGCVVKKTFTDDGKIAIRAQYMAW